MPASARRANKILIINVCNPLSHGGVAISISLLKLLEMAIPDSTVTLMTARWSDIEVYKGKYRVDNASFIKHTWYRHGRSVLASIVRSGLPAASTFFSCLAYNFLSRFGIKINNIYKEYDLILDLNSDALNEYYGFTYPFFALFELMLVFLSNKTVIVCPLSIGPFRNRLLKRLARFVLGKTDLIIARDETSRNYLQEIGISMSKIHFTADLAFLFEPVAHEEAKAILAKEGFEKGDEPLIGVAPSQEIHRYAFCGTDDRTDRYREYVKLMAEIVDFAIEEFSANVMLIPHFVDTRESHKNDRIVCRKIFQEVRNKQRAKLIQGNYRAHEIKGVIGLCDMFIACRMHSAISSMSSGIPTVALAYGHKFHAILGKMMGQEACIINVGSDFKSVSRQLKQKAEHVWQNRDSIREKLRERTKIVQERARTTVLLIKSVLEQRE